MEKLAPRPCVFDYLNYREFLSDVYTSRKKHERGFSYRAMARRLGFASPNFLKLVIDGQRNIGKESLEKIATELNLNRKESEYFSYLVFFAQAKNPVEKNYYFGLIAGLRARKGIKLLASDNFEYLSEWYHPVVREMVAGRRDPIDYEALSGAIAPVVSPARVKKSVDLLKRLGLVATSADGVYAVTDPILNTENELNSFAVRRFHGEVLGVARHVLDSVPVEEREFSHLTLKISAGGFAKFKQRIQALRQEFLHEASVDADADEVYHLNMQLYPVAATIPSEASHG